MHDHPAPSARRSGERALALTLALAATYMVAEVVGGLVSGSLALLADAAHMLSDVAALTLSLFAAWMARRPPTPRHTYGLYRTEILAAVVNGAALLAVSGFIVAEAWERLAAPAPVRGALMLAVAAGGLIVNGVGIALLHGEREASLNLRAAFLHVLGDALGSAAAVVAGVLIWWRGWTWTDPVASVLIALLVIRASWKLLVEAVGVLLEGAPGHVDVDAVREAIRAAPGVAAVHDLHVWTITSGLVALSCHVVQAEGVDPRATLAGVHALLREGHGIHHATVQVEPAGFDEPACPAC
jgi:cobalt-zinc-cadmium efflux system protein